MEIRAELKDGTGVLIRTMDEDDLDRSIAFFRGLSTEDRKYLRRDVTRSEVVAVRIDRMSSGQVKRLVAVVDDEIVADGSLELESMGWKRHVGELRLIVAQAFKRKGLGTLMARKLFALAEREHVEDIVVKMMKPQSAARHIFKKLGFREDAVLSDYVRDQSGAIQDLIVMRCSIEELMQELEHFMTDSDWQRTR